MGLGPCKHVCEAKDARLEYLGKRMSQVMKFLEKASNSTMDKVCF